MKRILALSVIFIVLAGGSLAWKYRVAERGIALDLDSGQRDLLVLARAEGFAAQEHPGSYLGRIIAEKGDCRFTAWFALRPLYEQDGYRKEAAAFGEIYYAWDGHRNAGLPVAAATYRYFRQGVLINMGMDNSRGAIVGVARNATCDDAQLPDFSQVSLDAQAKPEP